MNLIVADRSTRWRPTTQASRRGGAEAWPEVAQISDYVSFEPDRIDVELDGRALALEPGQTVIAHGIDRGLDPDELRPVTAGT